MNPIPLFGDESRLPRQLGPLMFSDVVHFDQAEMGVELRYNAPDMTKGDIYLYDLGLSDIPDDIMDEKVTELFQWSCEEVMRAGELGILQDVEVLTSQYLHMLGPDEAPTYLWAAFRYRQAAGPGTIYNGPRFSHLALRVDGGYINKVRYTYPEFLMDTAQSGGIAFLGEWYNAVQDLLGG